MAVTKSSSRADAGGKAAAQTSSSSMTTAVAAAASTTTLWSTILASTEGRRAKNVDNKRIVVLGHNGSGKSALIQQLAGPSATDAKAKGKAVDRTLHPYTNGVPLLDAASPDLALNYQYLDLLEEGDEDSPIRLSVYQASDASEKAASAVLPAALPPDELKNALVLILLDWEQPYTFLRTLRAWLAALHAHIASYSATVAQAKKFDYDMTEARENLESCVRSYTEPVVRNDASTSTASTTAVHSLASQYDQSPLPPGTLSANLGMNIVVVCTKAETIVSQGRNSQLSEEHTDYIQQMLRTICLQYGAALFCTSRHHPATFSRLRSYILHRLYTPYPPLHGHAPSASTGTTDSSVPAPGNTVHSALRSFPFSHRANVIDKTQLLVPSGWDTWGKIKILRQGFDCKGVVENWESVVVGRDTTLYSHGDAQEDGVVSAYEETLAHLAPSESSLRPHQPRLIAQDEQKFLRLHYKLLQKEKLKDPQRVGYRGGSVTGVAPTGNKAGGTTSLMKARMSSVSSTPRGAVGPMSGASTFDLPTVERALDREAAAATTTAATHSIQRVGSTSTLDISSLTAAGTAATATATSTSSTSSATQNKVLSDFFNSLLQNRSSTPTSGRAASPATATATATATAKERA